MVESGDSIDWECSTMFLGEYQHNIDDKGRIIIPARFRDELGDIFIITRGLDKALFVYPMSEWEVLEK